MHDVPRCSYHAVFCVAQGPNFKELSAIALQPFSALQQSQELSRKYTYTLSHVQPTSSSIALNLGQAEASTGTETATLGHHPQNPAFSQGLAGSVSLLTDSVTNA